MPMAMVKTAVRELEERASGALLPEVVAFSSGFQRGLVISR
jgi:hypothetical protein